MVSMPFQIVFEKKEDAERFAKCMHPYIGNYDCVYTRNEKEGNFC